MTTFDAVIVGAGQAGPPLAGRLTAAGMKVAVIERHLFGGTCVNTGCIPTKAMVASAYAAHTARRGDDYGFNTGPVSVDLGRVMARKDRISGNSRNGVRAWLDGMDGCTVIEGHARFEAPHLISVGDQTLEAEKIFLNVGGRALVPTMPGVDQIRTLTNSTLLKLEELPRHLVVIGGSYIGLEFAQMFRRFGSAVTVIERADRLIAREDEDISKAVREILEREGIDVICSADPISFASHPDGALVRVGAGESVREIAGSHVLIAIGRIPNTHDLGLDKAGVETDSKGYIVVDDQLRTNVAGIWAMGDCNGRGAFTHTAYNDFEIVAANLLDGDPRRVSDRITAYALYIDPPLGRVGLTEAQARADGRRLLKGIRPMSRVGRAVEKGEDQGFMKILVDADTQKLVGAAILGPGGDEAVHGLLDTMYADVPYAVLQRSMPIHPTVSELLPTVLGELK